MLDINNLRAGKAENLKGRFRVRMFDKISVPVVCEIQEVHEKLLLIDLPQAEGYEAKVLEAKNAELQLILANNSNAALAEEEKENLPQGCEKASENLKVTFLSIEKLDKLAADNQARMEENGFEMTSLDRFADFDLHLVPQREAHCLLNELTQKSIVAENEQPLSLIIFSEGASRHNNVLFFGFQWRAAPAKGLTTFKGRYMGDYHSSINRLERLESSFRQFLLDQTKCRCRFDALRDTVLVEKSGNFIPAMFIIETEWLKEKRSGDQDAARKMHTDNLFVMPPGNTAATIRFKPGWMDPRIALTNRINELRYLAELANNLKSGTLPWSKTESSKDQPEIVDSLNQLISGAKNKLDAQPVYPFDFTDRLWDLLKTVKSTDTLRQCFQLIYDQLQTGEFHVLVESNKVSSLAKMLRMRNPNDIIFPRLEPMACLQLLVEIGIDRFNGELAYRYSSGQYLPNSFDLDPFFLSQTKPFEHRIDRLFSMYIALQSLMTIGEYVLFPQHGKANLAKRLLEHFTTLQGTDAFEKEFCHKTMMEDIRNEKIKGKLSSWFLERKYLNGGISSAVYLSKNFGIKYLNKSMQDDVEREGNEVKREVQSPTAVADKTSNNKEGGDVEKEDNDSQFECIYLTICAQPDI